MYKSFLLKKDFTNDFLSNIVIFMFKRLTLISLDLNTSYCKVRTSLSQHGVCRKSPVLVDGLS